MTYELLFSTKAEEDLQQLKKSEPKVFQKAIKLINELRLHPKIGTGKPEELKYQLTGFWSRRLNQKHRIVYKIDDEKIIVMIVSAKGHYADK